MYKNLQEGETKWKGFTNAFDKWAQKRSKIKLMVEGMNVDEEGK